jgi:uncharacterized protein (TIGR00255 family)
MMGSTISSMTGFARSDGSLGSRRWVWELRSVNARGLDIRCRLPAGCEALEVPVRQRLGQRLKRGSLNASLSFVADAAPPAVRLNIALIDQLLGLVPALQARLPASPPPSIEGLLAVRGLIEPLDEAPSAEAAAAVEAAVLASLDPAIDALVRQRREEGDRLAAVVGAQLDRLADLTDRARTLAAAQPEALQARLAEQLAQLLAGQTPVPAERLAQEVALLATRADVREELDRLAAHHQAAAALLAGSPPIGRQLDFLCQEFNREANTLCSKSADIALTRVGLDLKAVIEQMREQVQNIE